MNGFIYGLKCPIDNEIRYVGQTKEKLCTRLHRHINTTKEKIRKNKRLTHKEQWIKKLINMNLDSNIKTEKIEECDINLLNEQEIFWISEFKKTNNLTNITEGGNQPRGYHFFHTEESKKNISDGIKKSEIFLISMKSKERIEKIKNTKKKNGYVVSETTKLKISNSLKGKRCGDKNSFYGKKHTNNAKAKIGEKNKINSKGENNPFYGKKHSKETKNKLSEHFKDKLQKKILMIDDDKNIIKEFTIVSELTKFLKCVNYMNILRYYLNQEKKCKGYYWKR